jgi:hypothetical protein
MTATALDDRAGRPTRVSLRFTQPLDHPSLVFLVFRDGGLRRLALMKEPIGAQNWEKKVQTF